MFSRFKNKHKKNIYEIHFSGSIAKKMSRNVEEVEQLILAILCPSSSAEESSMSSLASDDVGVAGVKRPLDDNGPGFVSSEVIFTAFSFLEFLLDRDLMGFYLSHVLEGGTPCIFL